MLTDEGIRAALDDQLLEIEPFADASLQPASYDLRVGEEAFVSGTDEKINVGDKGLVIIDPGEFAVIATRERVRCGPQVAGQLGLSSMYATQGLTLLSGPQIDPGFEGVLVVRVTNLAPRRVTLPYEAPFLTVQFFRLNAPVGKPYSGSRQGQTGLSPKDINDVSDPASPTLGGMVKSLSRLAADVGEMKTAIASLASSMSSVKWVVGFAYGVLALLLSVIGIVIAVRN